MEKEISVAVHSVDGVPMKKGMRVFLVREAWIDHYETRVAMPLAGTVLRVSDGENRSLLLHLESGSECRWYPTEHECREKRVYHSLKEAKLFAEELNRKAIKKREVGLEHEFIKLNKFKRICKLG